MNASIKGNELPKVVKMNKASAVNIRMKKYTATKNVNLLKEALKSKTGK